MITKPEIQNRVLNVLEESEYTNAKPESHLKTDLGMDSLDLVEFAMHLEKEFDISLSNEDVDNMNNMKVSEVVDLLGGVVNPS